MPDPASLPPEIVNELADYLGRARKDRDEGNTLKDLFKKLHDEGQETRKAVKTVADGLSAHEIECLKSKEAISATLAAMHHRVETLEAASTRNAAFEQEKARAALMAARASSAAAAKDPPPMRPEFDSSHDHSEEAARAAGILASQSPKVDLSADEVAKLIQPAVEQAFKERKAVENQKIADDIEAAKLESKKKWDKLKMQILGAVLVWTILGILGAVVAVFVVGAKIVAARELGHAEAIAEVKTVASQAASAIASQAVIPAPSASVSVSVIAQESQPAAGPKNQAAGAKPRAPAAVPPVPAAAAPATPPQPNPLR
jgi:hypothetical protein